MPDVDYDYKICWVNSFLESDSIRICYLSQAALCLLYEFVQGFLARRGLSLRYRLVLPFYRKFLYAFFAIILIRGLLYGIIHQFYYNQRLRTLFDPSPLNSLSRFLRFIIYIVVTTLFIAFQAAIVFIVSNPSAGLDGVEATKKFTRVIVCLHVLGWVVALSPMWYTPLVVVRLGFVAYCVLVIVRGVVWRRAYPRKAAIWIGTWSALTSLVETLLYIDFLADSKAMASSCFVKFWMTFFGGLFPLAVYIGLLVDSSHWRQLAVSRGFKGVSKSTMFKPLIQEFFPSRIVMDYHGFTILEELGHGAHASVFVAKYRNKDERLALKRMTATNMTDHAVTNFLSEALILSNIPAHENLVPLIGVSISPPWLCVVMERCDCSLFDYLAKARTEKRPVEHRLKLAIDIACGMEQLHQHNVIHRDLKSLNVLLTNTATARQADSESCAVELVPSSKEECVPIAKIADFGCSKLLAGSDSVKRSRQVSEESKTSSSLQSVHNFYDSYTSDSSDVLTGRVGTIPWCAPEVLRNESYDGQCDVFSMGVVLWELFTGCEPHSDGRRIRTKECMGEWRLPIPKHMPGPAQQLISTCWHSDPAVRPSFREIRETLESFPANIFDAKPFHTPIPTVPQFHRM